MDAILGASADLTTTEHLVNLVVVLTGQSGVDSIDYRTNVQLLASVGQRTVIRFVSSPVIELVTPTDAKVAYDIRAVHYARLSGSVPTTSASIAAIPGAVEIVRSQLLNTNRISIGPTPGVTDIIKPDPVIGYSPRLDIGWSSLGTTATSSVTVIVHCVVAASGTDLPAYS